MTESLRSWTDAVTNATLLSGFNTANYLSWIEKRSVNVNDILPQFLHEYTHHWCFDSLVGNTIALLNLRARRKCRLPQTGDNLGQISTDLVRYETATMMLQPFSEGLALFAEFDIKLRESTVLSQTLQSMLFCFGFAGKEAGDIATPITAMLQTMRRSRAFLERKAGIYAQPFECQEGYLAGYLAVKSLWFALLPRCRAFFDRDLFLSYLRSYIYDDPRLSLTILSGQTDEVRVSEAIANYIRVRFGALVEDPQLSAKVETWERSVALGKFDLSSIGAEQSMHNEAQVKMLRLLDDADEENEQGKLAVHAFATIKERRFFTLGSINVTAQVQRNGKCSINGTTHVNVSYQLDLDFQPGTYEGRVLVVVTANASCLMILLTIGTECYTIRSFGRSDQEEMSDLKRHAVNQQKSDSLHRKLETELENAVKDSALDVIATQTRGNVGKAAEKLYGILATLNVREDGCDLVLERLKEGGLLSLLDGDIDLLRAVAAISLANTLGTDFAAISLAAQMMRLGDEEIERTLKLDWENHRMKLISVHGRHALALV